MAKADVTGMSRKSIFSPPFLLTKRQNMDRHPSQCQKCSRPMARARFTRVVNIQTEDGTLAVRRIYVP
jgi:hypothetical protein